MRLALGFSGGIAVLTLVFAATIYWIVDRNLDASTQRAVIADAIGLQDRWAEQKIIGLMTTIAARSTVDAGDGVYLLVDKQGQPLAGTLIAWPPTVKQEAGDYVFWLRNADGRLQRVFGRVQMMAGLFPLLVGRKIGDQDALRQNLVTAIVFGGMALALGALGLGGIIGRQTLGRARRIGEALQKAGNGDLAARAPGGKYNDELGVLALRVNRTLDDLGVLVENLRTVADQTAHDLRAPMGRLSRALRFAQDAEPGEEQASAIETARAELDRILSLLDGLLEITHAGAEGPQGFAAVDLEEAASKAVELFRAVAEEAGVSLAVKTEEAVVAGDAMALMRVAANLLDNAIKFTPSGGTIRVTTGIQDNIAFLEVSDTGPGVPQRDREAIFDRLKRLPRDRETPGLGLGLAWVKAAVTRHRGNVKALPWDHGAVFRVELPRA